MATRKKQNTQSRNEKRKRKENKRKKQKTNKNPVAAAVVIGRKHQEQINSLLPAAWTTESDLDVALFDDSVFSQLRPEDQQQVKPVINALDLMARGQIENAESAVAGISRKSPMRDWKLLIRGLKHWYSNDLDAAGNAWSRLDVARRPSRIACALRLAHHRDLASLNTAKEPISAQPTDNLHANIDSSTLLGAKVVQRIRINRSAIKIARSGIARKTVYEREDAALTIIPDKLEWLKAFAAGYRRNESALVRALELTALERASQQNYADIFELATRQIRGPAHDPRNNLRSFWFWASPLNTNNKAKHFLKKYLTIDLPSIDTLSQPLKNAILSTTKLMEAEEAIYLEEDAYSPFNNFNDFDDRRNSLQSDISAQKLIRESLASAINGYPANRKAHSVYTDWLEKQIDSKTTDKKTVKQFQTELIDAMKFWADSLPADDKPRTFLAEALLEDEQLEEAAPHVEWLVKSRPNDPNVKALPWRLELLRAMKLSRRVSNLPQVPAALEEVKSLWPDWLSTRWLPYYTAAWMLRSGDHKSYQRQRDSICVESGVKQNSLVDACMMLGAAQKLKVPGKELQPLREPIEAVLKELRSLSDEDLIAAGSFFWNIHQAKILYPAFRMHGSKLGRELLRRILQNPKLVSLNTTNSEFLDSVFWLSEYKFWGDGYVLEIPSVIVKMADKNVYLTAAYLNAINKTKYVRYDQKILSAVQDFKESIRTEPNPFYRYWFGKLIEEANIKEQQTKNRSGFSNRFDGGFDPFDDDCECPDCVARRAKETPKVEPVDEPIEQSAWQPDLFS